MLGEANILPRLLWAAVVLFLMRGPNVIAMTVVVERGRCVGPNGQDFTRSFYFIGHPQCTGVRFIFLAVPKVGGCVIFTLQVLKWSWGGAQPPT